MKFLTKKSIGPLIRELRRIRHKVDTFRGQGLTNTPTTLSLAPPPPAAPPGAPARKQTQSGIPTPQLANQVVQSASQSQWSARLPTFC